MGKCIIMMNQSSGIHSEELTAEKEDVLKGKIAGVVGSDEPVIGTLELTGTAADSQVFSGQTYYNTDAKTKRTGTMLTMTGQTIMPGVIQQTISCAGKYMTGNITVGVIPSKYVDMSVGQTSFNYGSFSGLLASGMTLLKPSWQSTQGNRAGVGWMMPFQYPNGSWEHYEVASKLSINLSYIRTITVSGNVIFNGSSVGTFRVGVKPKNSQIVRILQSQRFGNASAEKTFTWTMDVSAYTGHQHLHFIADTEKATYDHDGNYTLVRTISFGI